MQARNIIEEKITQWLGRQGVADAPVRLDYPEEQAHGDYATNIALLVAKRLHKSSRDTAEEIKAFLLDGKIPFIRDISVAGPGFINIFFTQTEFITYLTTLLEDPEKVVPATKLKNKKIMVEFAHPNTHKEMHIGHMRTLITGEALSRLLEAVGATVFRANYQGDIGLHVAKAMYGVEKLLQERKQTLADIAGLSNTAKAHFLGEAYARGSRDYDTEKEAVDHINRELYGKTGQHWGQYQETRQWSLDYYDDFYTRFYTHFDKLFFESEMVERGKKIVEEHVADYEQSRRVADSEQSRRVFEKSEGAVVFPGEKYGLHTRVFVTGAGIPTYEGKDIGNAYAEYEAFPFDTNVHVVANEQTGYFQVVFKALSLLDPEKFGESMYHLPMGMVQLTDPSAHSASSGRAGSSQSGGQAGQARKISSRTGDVLTVDWLIDEVKDRVYELMTDPSTGSGQGLGGEDRDAVAEEIAIGAIKYSVLKVGATQNVAFSIESSVSMDGDSGPYLQYTYARTQSILRRAKEEGIVAGDLGGQNFHTKPEEEALLKTLYRFGDVVQESAQNYSPNILCTYLFSLAKLYNLFYQNVPILKESGELRDLRLRLTAATGAIMKRGLSLLGIKAPEKM